MEDSYYAHPTAIIDPGATLGPGTQVWHFSHVSAGAILGERCKLGQNVFVADGVVLGTNVKVQNNVSLYAGVTCGDDVFLGPSVVFTNVTNPRSAVDRRGDYVRTHVGRGATIGANATVVCGHDIGTFAFIGAGAVVTHAVLPYALVVGNPARQLGWVGEAGVRLDFDGEGRATCRETGQEYRLAGGRVERIA